MIVGKLSAYRRKNRLGQQPQKKRIAGSKTRWIRIPRSGPLGPEGEGPKLKDPNLFRFEHSLSAVLHAELVVDVRQVGPDRRRRDIELRGDLFVV